MSTEPKNLHVSEALLTEFDTMARSQSVRCRATGAERIDGGPGEVQY